MSSMPPANGWYFGWVAYHQKKTAANPEAVAALIECEDIATDIWEATSEELHECTRRLVATARTPRFANEHADAIGTELVVLRRERVRDGFMMPEPGQVTTDCPWSCNAGLLFGPLPWIVREYPNVCRKWLQTCAILCDQCPRGLAEIAAQQRVAACAAPDEKWKSKTLRTMTEYLDRIGGRDAITILRDFEAKRAADARSIYGAANARDFPTMAALLANTVAVPPKQYPRNDLASIPD